MAIRKDSKGRFLRRGETQRKDGRYCYKYVDAKGRADRSKRAEFIQQGHQLIEAATK